MTRVDSSVPLMHCDLSDLGSLIAIQISPKDCNLMIVSITTREIFLTGSGKSQVFVREKVFNLREKSSYG